MERFYKKISPAVEVSPINRPTPVQPKASSMEENTEVDLENLPSDPGLRPDIMSYPPNLVERIRRAYLLKGPCQPREHDFPQTMDGNRKRKFVKFWFDEFKPWLEYSIAKDAAFCLYCYLFSLGRDERGHDAKDSFSAFDTKKLLRLAKFYPCEFSEVGLYELESQLQNFIFDMRLDEKYSKVSGIGGLAQMMISTGKHEVFPLVYLLVKLCLILPVATATVERAFSAMNIIKSSLRNRMGDKLLNDCLVPYIEKDVFVDVTNEAIIQRFQNMKNKREML